MNTWLVPSHRMPTTPGELLLKEFLEPCGITPDVLADRMGIPLSHVQQLIAGDRVVTEELASSLARQTETTAKFWLNAQRVLDRYHEAHVSGTK